MKKKLLSILLVAVLILSMSACGAATPTEVTTSFLEAVKAQNTEAMAAIYEDESWSLYGVAEDEAAIEDMDELSKYFQKEVMPKMLDFEYEILEEKIEGEKATVDVKVTTYDLGQAIIEFFGDYFVEAFALAFNGADEEELNSIATKILIEKVEVMEKDFAETVSITLSQEDGNWVIDEIDEDGPLTNVLLGDLIEAADQIEDSFN